jgi:RHS repeat-associated protein
MGNDPQDRRSERYLYNSADLRIYKQEEQQWLANDDDESTAAVTVSEFYLRDAMGRELGVLDLNQMTWSCYLFGTARFARIQPEDGQQPAAYTNNLGQRGALDPNNTEFNLLTAFLVSQLDGQNRLPLPTEVVCVDRSPNLPPLFMTRALYETEVATDPALGLAKTWALVIADMAQQLRFTLPDGTGIALSVQEALDQGMLNQRAAGTYPPTYTTVANTDLASVTYYVHDHLGNSRVVYTPDPGCGVGGSTTYALDYVGDYFPYGKVLREAVNGPMEKYLTTHHQRDVETGLDYRGARYYDADVARFLSLDPLAADYAKWSSYSYVMAAPTSCVDKDGRRVDIVITGTNNSSVTVKTDLIDVKIDASFLNKDFGGAYVLTGQDILITALDIVGCVDPTPISDALSAKLSFDAGDYWGAAQSLCGTLSYVGDLAKGPKIIKGLDRIDDAIDAQKRVSKAGGVKPYEVGTADALSSRSVKGDGLDVHHAGQAHPMEQLVPGYSRETGPAITVPRDEHVRIPTVRGPVTGTPRGQLAKDIRDLRNNTNAPNTKLQELIDLNKSTYSNSFAK